MTEVCNDTGATPWQNLSYWELIQFQGRQLYWNWLYLPSEMGSTLKGKNLLPMGANSFLLEKTSFQKGYVQKVTKVFESTSCIVPWKQRVNVLKFGIERNLVTLLKQLFMFRFLKFSYYCSKLGIFTIYKLVHKHSLVSACTVHELLNIVVWKQTAHARLTRLSMFVGKQILWWCISACILTGAS